MRRADLVVALALVIGAGYMAQRYDVSPTEPNMHVQTGSHAPVTGPLRIGIEGNFAPFNEKRPDGRLEGLDIDVAEAVCAELRRKCIFVIRPWDEIIEGLVARDYDAIISSMRTSSIEDDRLAFTQPYYRTPGRFAVRKDSSIAKADEENLSDIQISVVGGTLHQRFLEARFNTTDIRPVSSKTTALAGLAQGKYEGTFGDSATLYQWLKTPEGQCCRLLDPGFDEERFFGPGIAIVLRAEDKNLQKHTNEALNDMEKDGTLQQITGRYFPFPLL